MDDMEMQQRDPIKVLSECYTENMMAIQTMMQSVPVITELMTEKTNEPATRLKVKMKKVGSYYYSMQDLAMEGLKEHYTTLCSNFVLGLDADHTSDYYEHFQRYKKSSSMMISTASKFAIKSGYWLLYASDQVKSFEDFDKRITDEDIARYPNLLAVNTIPQFLPTIEIIVKEWYSSRAFITNNDLLQTMFAGYDQFKAHADELIRLLNTASDAFDTWLNLCQDNWGFIYPCQFELRHYINKDISTIKDRYQMLDQIYNEKF